MSKVWNDGPKQSIKDDEFERAQFAAAAADLIVSSRSDDESVVFGLTGAWGSGKSTMLNFIEKSVQKSHPTWQVARFTPWAASDVGGMLDEFYATLAGVLPKDRSKQVRSALGKLAQVAAPTATAIPIMGDSAAAMVRGAGAFLTGQQPWDKQFAKASATLRELNIPVLLIVDDIDRLQTQELLALLKVIRLLGRFPGVQYLLAYDEATLSQALSKANLVNEHDGSASRFIEKIVQYPLTIPLLLDTELLRRLDTKLDQVIKDAGRPELSSARLASLRSVYLSQLPTPRAIDRFVAQIEYYLPLLPAEEVEDEDVMMLTLLQTAFPVLYARLPRWRSELVSGHTDEFDFTTPGSHFKTFDPEPLLATVPADARADAHTLLTTLFPRLKPDRLHQTDLRGRHVSNDQYFGRYFVKGILAGDLSDAQVAAAVMAAGNGDSEPLLGLLALPEAERVTLVLDKGERCTDQIAPGRQGDGQRLAILSAIMPMIDRVVDRASIFINTRAQIAVWAAKLLTQLASDTPAAEVTRALDATPRLGNRIRVLRSVDRLATSAPQWLLEVLDACSDQATEAALVHIRACDNAPLDEPIGAMFEFLIMRHRTEPLAEAIASGIAEGEFTIADVAARFVQITQVLDVPGAEPHLDGFDQAGFDRFAPTTSDLWYSASTVQVDPTDLNWANRRAHAAGRGKQPGNRRMHETP